jgi:hypothetical protein
MSRGLGRVPPIRGTLLPDGDQAGGYEPACRCPPASPEGAGDLAEGTRDTTRPYQPAGEAQSRGRLTPGLAPGALGWPWHPRRLATARHRERRVGLAGRPAGHQRPVPRAVR